MSFDKYLKVIKEDFRPAIKVEWLNPDESVNFEFTNALYNIDVDLSVNYTNGSRRSCTLTLNNDRNVFPINFDNIWIGQKFKLWMGIYLDEKTPYYFPQGVFYITNPSDSYNPNTRTVTINGVDKWCYLDGTLYGRLTGTYQTNIDNDLFAATRALLKLPRFDDMAYSLSWQLYEYNLSLKNEYKKAKDRGLQEYLSQIKDGTIQKVYGNVDMNNRTSIEWTEELRETYKDALESWDYNPDIGTVDTVFGGSDRFGEDLNDTGWEIAFTPILPDGTFLSKNTVYKYLDAILAEAYKTDNQVTEAELKAIDAKGKQVGDILVKGIFAAIDDSTKYWVYIVTKDTERDSEKVYYEYNKEDNIFEIYTGDLVENKYIFQTNWAAAVGRLMHFSGKFGAIEILTEKIKDVEKQIDALPPTSKEDMIDSTPPLLSPMLKDKTTYVLTIDKERDSKKTYYEYDKTSKTYVEYTGDSLEGKYIEKRVLDCPYTAIVERGGTFADVLLEYATILCANIYYDVNGRLVLEPMIDTAEDITDINKEILWHYTVDEKTFLGLTQKHEFEKIHNDFIVLGNIVNGYQFKGRVQNRNLLSDTCVQKIGLRTREPYEDNQYYSDEQCIELAKYYAKTDTILQKSGNISSVTLYHLDVNKLITVSTPNNNMSKELFLITGFSLSASGEMTLNISSVNILKDFSVVEASLYE